jgi:Ca2+-binding RTX toxin-like protein
MMSKISERSKILSMFLIGAVISLGLANIFTYASAEIIVGTSEDDKLKGSDEQDFIDAGAGDDKISAGDGNDAVNTGEGDDKVKCGDGDDTVFEFGDDKIKKDCERIT